jgi:arginase
VSAARPRLELIGVPSNSAGTLDGVARAPAALRRAGLPEALARHADLVDAGDLELPPPSTRRDPASGLIAEDALVAMVAAVRAATGRALARGRLPLLVGGDCPLLLGCLAAARDAHGHVGLLFADGHEDAWPPLRSPTGEAADCELGLALGHGRERLHPALAALLPLLAPEEVVLLGPRDAAELQAAGVPSLARAVELHPAAALAAAGVERVTRRALDRLARRAPALWLHVDLDVLATEALAAVDYPQSGGLGWDDLEALAAVALASPRLVGADVTIYNPDLDPDGAGAARIVAWLGAAAAVREQVARRRGPAAGPPR